LDVLADGVDLLPTADGRDKSRAASLARLARMIGRDAAEAEMQAWRDLAAWFAEAQLRRIEDAARLVLSRAPLPPDAPVIAAGIGGAVIARLAGRLNRSCRPFAEQFEGGSADPAWLSACAPALAVALLAAKER
jgi:uncharacterized hydantoinase/oxoprolinase family protein